MNFNGSISILKDITGVKLIQFNTVNNFPVPSWVIFSVKLLNCCCRAEGGGAAWEMELCCLLMPALPVFCHSACLLQQSQGDLLICSFAGFISRAEVVVTQRSRLWNCSFVQEQNHLFLGSTWSVPLFVSVLLSCSCSSFPQQCLVQVFWARVYLLVEWTRLRAYALTNQISARWNDGLSGEIAVTQCWLSVLMENVISSQIKSCWTQSFFASDFFKITSSKPASREDIWRQSCESWSST